MKASYWFESAQGLVLISRLWFTLAVWICYSNRTITATTYVWIHGWMCWQMSKAITSVRSQSHRPCVPVPRPGWKHL